jgi:hypothetical protein
MRVLIATRQQCEKRCEKDTGRLIRTRAFVGIVRGTYFCGGGRYWDAWRVSEGLQLTSTRRIGVAENETACFVPVLQRRSGN